MWDSLAKLFMCLGKKNNSPVQHKDISDISPNFEMTGVQLSVSEMIISLEEKKHFGYYSFCACLK